MGPGMFAQGSKNNTMGRRAKRAVMQSRCARVSSQSGVQSDDDCAAGDRDEGWCPVEGGAGRGERQTPGAGGAPPSNNRITRHTWRAEGRWVDRRTISAVWLDGVHECSDNQHVKKASSTTTCRGIVGLPF